MQRPLNAAEKTRRRQRTSSTDGAEQPKSQLNPESRVGEERDELKARAAGQAD